MGSERIQSTSRSRLEDTSAACPDLKAMTKICEGLDRNIDPIALGMTPNQIALSGKLWTIPTSNLEDRAMDTMCNVGEGNGLEVCRKLARRVVVRTAGHDRGCLVHLIPPDAELLKLDYIPRVNTLEELLKQHERLSGEQVPDTIKAGGLSAKLAPKDAKKNLALNPHRLVTHRQIKDEIESFALASSGLDESAMDLNALTWDDKWQRFVDPKKVLKDKGKGKGKHYKGSESWKGPFADQQKGKGKGNGKKGKDGNGGKGKRFDGS